MWHTTTSWPSIPIVIALLASSLQLWRNWIPNQTRWTHIVLEPKLELDKCFNPVLHNFWFFRRFNKTFSIVGRMHFSGTLWNIIHCTLIWCGTTQISMSGVCAIGGIVESNPNSKPDWVWSSFSKHRNSRLGKFWSLQNVLSKRNTSCWHRSAVAIPSNQHTHLQSRNLLEKKTLKNEWIFQHWVHSCWPF